MNGPQSVKLGRNAPCSCGSGKKYKHCCLPGIGLKQRHAADIEEIDLRAQQAAAEGNFEDAVLGFRQLLSAMPNHPYALASLGQSLCWLHKRREGVSYLLQAAGRLEKQAAKTGDIQFILELSGQLLHWGETGNSERLARLAVKLQPNSPQALHNLAECLTRVNRNAEALSYARRVRELLPDQPACNNLLAIIEASLGNRSRARDLFKRVIELDADREQTARACRELANLLDKEGNHDAAFKYLSMASELNVGVPKEHAASPDFLFNSVARNKAGFSLELLQRWPATRLIDDGLPAPAFLVGFPRSGTTLTEQVLASHPGVIAIDESSIIHELTRELAAISHVPDNVPLALAGLNLQQIKHLRSFFWRRMGEEHGGDVIRKRLIDKNALNTIELGLISVVFPDARILFALRDPRDICISCYMQSFLPSPATINLQSWEGIARQYAAVMDFWLYLKDLMQPNYLPLRYEDIVLDFETSYRRVFDFLGIEWRPEVIRFYERTKNKFISTPSYSAVSQPIYKTAVARWKHYETYFQPILPQLQRFILAFGYPET